MSSSAVYSATIPFLISPVSGISISFFISPALHPPALHSFPTRRSSDLLMLMSGGPRRGLGMGDHHQVPARADRGGCRSEEHTSELQSRGHLVCRLLLEKKNYTTDI